MFTYFLHVCSVFGLWPRKQQKTKQEVHHSTADFIDFSSPALIFRFTLNGIMKGIQNNKQSPSRCGLFFSQPGQVLRRMANFRSSATSPVPIIFRANDIPFRRQLTASELLLYTTPFAGKSIFDLELETVADE